MDTQVWKILDARFHLLAQIVRHFFPRRIVSNFEQVYTWFFQRRSIIPPHLLIKGVRIMPGDAYNTIGGSADIYSGQFNGIAVAVKVPRVTQVNRIGVLQDCINEVMIMDSLGHHRHIVEIFGVFLDQRTGVPCIVTPWMDYGTLTDVIRLTPSTEYRKSMVEQIVDGMSFLKISNVVHGDLKCSNILIAPDGRACIADFGLAHFSGASPSISSNDLSGWNFAQGAVSWILQRNVPRLLDAKTSLGAGSPRWMAPERLWPERWELITATATFASDVFSLGMMIYEIYSGKVPFFAFNDHMSILLIVQGNRPIRPPLINDRLWHLAERCWNPDPAARPFIQNIKSEINQCDDLAVHQSDESKT